MRKLLLLGVRAYRLAISPLFPPRCRFLPSCSDYALQAIEQHGALKGGGLALRRFLRCNPFSPGGIDEVPEHRPGSSPFMRLAPRLAGVHSLTCRSCRRPQGVSGNPASRPTARSSANR